MGLWRWLIKALVVFSVILAAYVIYLDAQIKHKFNGNKWQVPAQIYARPLAIEVGQEITPKEVIDELKLLGYRQSNPVDSSGEYALQNNQVIFMRRAFAFVDGYEPVRKIRVQWTANKVSRVTDLSTATEPNAIRVEPLLVTRDLDGGSEDRMLLDLSTAPEFLAKALTLVEDRDFYDHHGVAPLSILRALIANIRAGRTVQGGSTLTQQLIKNLYLSREQTITRKAKEAIMAIIIDARYSKTEILQAYMNEVFLGQHGGTAIHGFGLASYFYFDLPVNELDITQIATLVGMVKGPSYYNPRRYPERAVERRDLVLKILFEANEIDRATFEQSLSTPLKLSNGERLLSIQHPAFMQQVTRELDQIVLDEEVRESGIKVFTTLDINAQRRAEKALTETLDGLQKDRKVPLEGAMIATDIKSGEVRVIIGSRNTGFKGFNRALDAKRQVGSLIKPAVYIAALDDPIHYNLATTLDDKPITLDDSQGKTWSPLNADKKFRGSVPLLDGLVHSLNVPTVNLGMQLGLPRVAEAIAELGGELDAPMTPAMTLGAMSMTPMTVNQMYQTIANSGRYAPLHTITAVLSVHDNVIWQKAEFFAQRVSEQSSYLLNYALYKVTQEGTAKRIAKTFPNINMAGKTGTTDDYRDSWFSGFDRNIVSTVWVGNDDNQPINLTGAGGALPVFINYQRLQQPKSLSQRFPQGLGIAHFDGTTGAPVAAGCPGSLSVPAVLDVLPSRLASCVNGSQKPSSQPPAKSPAKKKSERTWWERLLGIGG